MRKRGYSVDFPLLISAIPSHRCAGLSFCVTSFLQGTEMLVLGYNIPIKAIAAGNPQTDRQPIKIHSEHENGFLTSGGATSKTIRPLQECTGDILEKEGGGK